MSGFTLEDADSSIVLNISASVTSYYLKGRFSWPGIRLIQD